jgi:hypothetical protein
LRRLVRPVAVVPEQRDAVSFVVYAAIRCDEIQIAVAIDVRRDDVEGGQRDRIDGRLRQRTVAIVEQHRDARQVRPVRGGHIRLAVAVEVGRHSGPGMARGRIQPGVVSEPRRLKDGRPR